MVNPLTEGTYTADESKVFMPFDALKDNRNDRSPGSLLVDIVPFLVKTKNDLVVIDPGLGFQLSDGKFQIHQNIINTGFSPDDVSIVLLSHLHKDHTGGICFGAHDAFNLMFPNARYFVQEKEMEFAFTKKNSPSYVFGKLEFLLRSPNLNLLNGNGSISHEIHFELSGGHTPFHQVFLIEDEREKYFFGGDVLPQSSQLIRKFVAKYDYDGQSAAQKRIEYGHRAAHENWTCLFFHSADIPVATVEEESTGRFLILKK